MQKPAFSSCQQGQHQAQARRAQRRGEQPPAPSAVRSEHPCIRQMQHLSRLCPLSLLPPFRSPRPSSRGLLPGCPCVKALRAVRGLRSLHPVLRCSALDGGIFTLPLGRKGLQQNLAVSKLMTVYPAERRLEHRVGAPERQPKWKPSRLSTVFQRSQPLWSRVALPVAVTAHTVLLVLMPLCHW